jgi:outer membrane protein OmpA-like peptidoglycan-associated protein
MSGGYLLPSQCAIVPPPTTTTQYFPDKKAVVFAIILVLTTPCFSDDFRFLDGFFIEGSYHQYFTPEFLSELVKTKPGFRAALGYDFRHFRFAVESGYTNFDGTNPLVLDITVIPLALKFGYELPIVWGFGVQADLHAGYFFSKTFRYPTAIDMLLNNLQEDNERNLFTGLRIYATWTTKGKFLKIYVGGGADVVIEPEGPIPMPLLEAGVSIKPFTLNKPSAKKEELVNSVLFEVNSTAIKNEYLPTLDEAGRRLNEKPSLRITMVTYAPPEGDVECQVRRNDGTPALSAARAEYCAEYLRENYGIDPSRIKIEYKEVDKVSQNTPRESFHSVDLTIK